MMIFSPRQHVVLRRPVNVVHRIVTPVEDKFPVFILTLIKYEHRYISSSYSQYFAQLRYTQSFGTCAWIT